MCAAASSGVKNRSPNAPMAACAAAMRRPQPLTTAYCMTEIAQQPPLRGCPTIVAADDCTDSLDFRSCFSWLDHSTGADHRSRSFQLTPSVALSLSLSNFCYVLASSLAARHLSLWALCWSIRRCTTCRFRLRARVEAQTLADVSASPERRRASAGPGRFASSSIA